MQARLSLLLLVLTIGNALAAPAAVPRPYGQEQTGDLRSPRAELAASIAALQSAPQTGDSMLGMAHALAKRVIGATQGTYLNPVEDLPSREDDVPKHLSAGYVKRGEWRQGSSTDSHTVQSPDDSASEDDALLLGRTPRKFGKRLGIALGGGAFGAMMAQLGQALIIGVDPQPLKGKRSLHDVRGWDDKENDLVQEKRAPPPTAFFDALARKLIEKFFTSGGGGVIYQPLRYKFRQIFGKSQHGHT
ncbi:hypothetical protein BCV69DRAFT_174365 [Microstroma glucosiphilum]|uniref:Uncharacterized protein n=1 Tax=Pseudomicrostroma glucosiphilum TaxID=1684307 RepID=A0A316UAT3_9BASI|nr:hypothetical protein BCV69DRAFT_174365 [Pseudomicrostroma glucosiphilum]PWN21581.1 hypothetical protein BCV69DRAFT_174365 [Pseudomicrostroma glucosiphilum]